MGRLGTRRWEADLRRDDGRIVFVTPPGTRRERPRRGEVEVTRCLEVSGSGGAGWIVTAVVGDDGALVSQVDATLGDEERRQDVFAFATSTWTWRSRTARRRWRTSPSSRNAAAAWATRRAS